MNRVNFLPEDYVQARQRRRSTVICATLLGVIIGGVTVVGLAFRVSIKQLQNQSVAVQQKCGTEYRTIQNLEDLSARQQAIARQAELTASMLEKQLPRSSILSEVGRALPLGVALTELTLEDSDAPAAGSQEITISGEAEADQLIADFVVQLKRSRMFANVRRRPLETAGGNGKPREFRVEMSLNSQTSALLDLPQTHSETVSLDPE